MAEKRAAEHKRRSDAAKNSPNANYKNPEWLAKRALARSLGGNNSTRSGVPDGYTRDGVLRARRVHRTFAKRIVEKILAMTDAKTRETFTGTDGEAAKEALTVAVEIMRDKGALITTKDRLAAANTVLAYCKSKPASKVEATIKRAEDYLDELDDDGEPGDPGPEDKAESETPPTA